MAFPNQQFGGSFGATNGLLGQPLASQMAQSGPVQIAQPQVPTFGTPVASTVTNTVQDQSQINQIPTGLIGAEQALQAGGIGSIDALLQGAGTARADLAGGGTNALNR
ncbi:MAG: hypothetical protein JKY50_12555, partial [Oleispira sp.]|nr:hypothetical protein [Oleispira sp.]